MARANIIGTVWNRHVHSKWRIPAGWRTDMPTSVFNNEDLAGAQFILDGGPTVKIPMDELRQALASAPRRLNGMKVGPYNVNPAASTVNGVKVTMTFISTPTDASIDLARRTWASGESTWHKETVQKIASSPELAGIEHEGNKIVRRWNDSIISGDGRRLWKKLLSRKHPDVVFEHANGQITVVEVEPSHTIFEGIGQITGDYIVNLQVDRLAVGENPVIVGVLVTDSVNSELDTWAQFLDFYSTRVTTVAES